MPAPSSPAILIASAGDGHGSRGRAARGAADLHDLRVSDAERAAIADELGRHYGEGRLDDQEFGRRLDQAMAATTYRDLTGLLHDLPHGDGPLARPGPGPRRSRRSGPRQLGLLALIAIAVLAVTRVIVSTHAPTLWIAVVAAIAVLAVPLSRRR